MSSKWSRITSSVKNPAPRGCGANIAVLHSRLCQEVSGAFMVATLNGRLKLQIRDDWSSKTARLGYEIFVPLNTYYRMPSMGAEVGDWQIAAVNAGLTLTTLTWLSLAPA